VLSSRDPRRSERGVVLVLLALLAIVILGIIGLAVDSNHVEDAGQRLQSAADAAALAGAGRLSDESSALGGSYTATRSAAVSIAGLNQADNTAIHIDNNSGNAANGDVVVGVWNSTAKTFTPTTISPNAVKVVARRTAGSTDGAMPLSFGALFGVSSSDVSRDAIAINTKQPNPYIIVLDPSKSGALSMGGSSSIDASGGKIQVNSSSNCAIKQNGNANLNSDKTSVHGNACGGGSTTLTNLNPGADVLTDPLGTILPGASDWTALKSSLAQPAGANGKITSSGSFAPGYYPKGLSINSGTAVVLTGGTYMFGADVSVGGNATVTGLGVTILLDTGVSLSIGGGGSLVLTPPTSGTFEGLSLMCSRGTSSSTAITLGGNGVIDCKGTVYAPGAGISLSGTGGAQSIGQLVCNTLDVSGNGHVTGQSTVPSKTAGGSIALVR
jgi:Flp pilus assembly protein TadG